MFRLASEGTTISKHVCARWPTHATSRLSSTTTAAASNALAVGPHVGPPVVLHSRMASIMPHLNDPSNGTLHGMVMRRVLGHPPEKPAFVCGNTGRVVTYGGFVKNVHDIAATLYHSHNIRHGDVVVLMSPNTPDFGAIFQAILSLGAIVSPVNPIFTATDVCRQAILAKAKLLIAVSAFKVTADETVKLAAAQHVHLDTYFPDVQPLATTPVPASYAFHASPDDTIVLPFSSGTTGLPKGVQLTNRNLVANVFQTEAATQSAARDVYISVLPFFHIYGLTVLLNAGMTSGVTQVTFPRFDMVNYLKALEAHRATMLFVAPPMMVGFAKHPLTKSTDTSSVEYVMSGAAPLTEEVQRMCEPLFPRALVGQGYGLSETSPVVSIITRDGKQRYGDSGQLAPDTSARVVAVADDGSYRDLAVGEEGELWVQGPQVMKGYLQQQDTDVILPPVEKGKWLRTGDLVRFDGDGHVTVTDRVKELIKYKGCQVAPAELEGLLQQHPDVAEAIVVGIESACGTGEVPLARVVLRHGVDHSHDTADRIRHFVDSQVRPQCKLRGGVFVVPEVPKTASGKLLRRHVRDEVRQLIKEGKLAASH